jgi:hypothetical protein
MDGLLSPLVFRWSDSSQNETEDDGSPVAEERSFGGASLNLFHEH